MNKITENLLQALSGFGKTVAYAIGVLQSIDTDPKSSISEHCQALIVAPTRENALQIAYVVHSLGEYMSVKVQACVGGTVVKEDIKQLKYGGTHVVVGTPGRIHDMMKRGFLKTDNLKIIVIDDADEIFSRSFKTQIQGIFKFLLGEIQFVFFSATLTTEILAMTKHIMRDPAMIIIKNQELTLEGIHQYYITVEKEDWKMDVLLNLFANLTNLAINQAIIYCNTKKRVEELEKLLTGNEFTVSIMHGEMDQLMRDFVMKQFRSGSVRVLITTEFFAKDIDMGQVSIVINYELPFKKENYIHRFARASPNGQGRKRTAINFVLPKDAVFIK